MHACGITQVLAPKLSHMPTVLLQSSRKVSSYLQLVSSRTGIKTYCLPIIKYGLNCNVFLYAICEKMYNMGCRIPLLTATCRQAAHV